MAVQPSTSIWHVLRGRPSRLMLAVVAAVGVLIAGPVASGHAQPGGSVADLEAELAKLRKEAGTLIARYNAGRRDLAAATRAERLAKIRLERSEAALETARTRISGLAALSYQNANPDPVTSLLSADDPQAVLDQTAYLSQLSGQQQAVVSEFTEIWTAQREAADNAHRRAAEIKTMTRDLAAKRKRAEAAVGRMEAKIARVRLIPIPQRIRSWPAEVAGGSDFITPRMRTVRNEVVRRFHPPYGVGCYRALEDGGDHPRGRACDFMLSTGGAMPTPEHIELGWDIAVWAQNNADRYGIVYIIYRQKIWHINNQAAGWEPMENRGGVTANHYDHPHISVF